MGSSQVPIAYGGWCIEAMDAHGGWIASAPELVRFGACFDAPRNCPILGAKTIEQMFRRPGESGYEAHKKEALYACGWEVRTVAGAGCNTWHTGMLNGSASLLVRRFDGLTWAVVFNSDMDQRGKSLIELIDPELHRLADGVTEWPAGQQWDEGQCGTRGRR